MTAPDDVGRAAGGIADEDPDRLVRILRGCAGRQECQQKNNPPHHYLIEKSFLPPTGISAVRISPFIESVM